MGMKKVSFTKQRKNAITYSIVKGGSGFDTIMFRASPQVAEKTGFNPGDHYEVYFDGETGAMQIQRVPLKTRNSHRIRVVKANGRSISGMSFGFCKWPFEGFFPKAKLKPVELLKAESGVLLINAPREETEEDE